jgi:hypothetical protein
VDITAMLRRPVHKDRRGGDGVHTGNSLEAIAS